MHRVINNMKIVRLFSFIILIGAYLSADSNSGNLPAPIPIDFGVNNGIRSDSTICESCNTIYEPDIMGASCCDDAYELSVGSEAYPNGITCGVLEGDYLWNCSGCGCEGDDGWTTIFGCKDNGSCTVEVGPEPFECGYDSPYSGIAACNFDPDAGVIWDDGSCEYAMENYDCDGNCIVELDECDVCSGDNSTCSDECGVPWGDNSFCADECGVPNGDNTSCADCAGVPNGDSI